MTSLIRDRFTRESDRLHLEWIELKKIGGQKGELRHSPLLLGAKTPEPIGQVLSEGEQTALGLAGYFTEAHFDTSRSALVLDDPVTSLDYIRRAGRSTARRASPGPAGHRLLRITSRLCRPPSGCRRGQVGFTKRGVQRHGDSTPGLCTDEHPWKVKDVLRRFDELTQKLVGIKRERANWTSTPTRRNAPTGPASCPRHGSE